MDLATKARDLVAIHFEANERYSRSGFEDRDAVETMHGASRAIALLSQISAACNRGEKLRDQVRYFAAYDKSSRDLGSKWLRKYLNDLLMEVESE